jgi:hypothetical protein
VTSRSRPPGAATGRGDDDHDGTPEGYVWPSREVIGHHVALHLAKCGRDPMDGTAQTICQHVRLVRCGCDQPLVWLIKRDATCRYALAALHGRASVTPAAGDAS